MFHEHKFRLQLELLCSLETFITTYLQHKRQITKRLLSLLSHRPEFQAQCARRIPLATKADITVY
jgi:hypothetical protein